MLPTRFRGRAHARRYVVGLLKPALIIGLCALGSLALMGAPSGRPSTARNVVLVLTDDQALDTIGRFNPQVETPQLDGLIRDGTWFSRAFVTTSVCPASRATIISGMHFPAHRYTFLRHRPDFSFLKLSYPALLRDAGYYSGFIGKNGMRLDPDRAELLFDEWTFYPREYFDGKGVHLTDKLAKQAARFIESQDASRPWSLLLWMHAPHANGDAKEDEEYYEPPTRYEHLYDGVVFPPRPGADGLASRPEWFNQTSNYFNAGRWDSTNYQRNMRRYHAMIRGVDDAVGRIRQALRRSGQAEDTLIVFLSDNGLYRGDRGFGGKWLGHDVSIRVPMVVVDPSRRGGSIVDQMVTNADIAPTLLDLLDLQIPNSMQGRSMRPLLEGESVSWPENIFIEHSWDGRFREDDVPVIPLTRGVRTATHKYLEYPETGYRELYDLRVDPDEMHNLAGRRDVDVIERRLARLTATREFEYRSDFFADGFESGDTSRWPQQQIVGGGVGVTRGGIAPHEQTLSLSVSREQPAFVGLDLPPRRIAGTSFLLSTRDVRDSEAVEVLRFAGKSRPAARLLVEAKRGQRSLILRGDRGDEARFPIGGGWVSVQLDWARRGKRITLTVDGEPQGSVRVRSRSIRAMRIGLPGGGGKGQGVIRLDEFVVTSR